MLKFSARQNDLNRGTQIGKKEFLKLTGKLHIEYTNV
jgi:hypothetical protein